MALQTFQFPADPADPANGAPAGAYVAADVASQLEQTLAKLVWTVLYGKSHDASSLAVAADQLLGTLKAKAAQAA